jgi:hypothetical protein
MVEQTLAPLADLSFAGGEVGVLLADPKRNLHVRAEAYASNPTEERFVGLESGDIGFNEQKPVWTKGCPLRFCTRESIVTTTVEERLRVAADGKVGIRHTNPTYDLHVYGNTCSTRGF